MKIQFHFCAAIGIVPMLAAVPALPQEKSPKELGLFNTARLQRMASESTGTNDSPDRGLDLRGRDLSKMDLRLVDAAYSQLQKAILRDSTLEGANLAKSDFTGARLDDARAGRANLSRAILVDASLRRANLKHANLIGADCRGADFLGAVLEGTYLAYADLRGSRNLTVAQLRTAYWPPGNSPIVDSELADAVAPGDDGGALTTLRGPDLAGADLTGRNLRDANLRGSDLSDAILRNATLAGADLTGANLDRADLSGGDLWKARGLTVEQLESARWDPESPPRVDDDLSKRLSRSSRSSSLPIEKLVRDSLVIDGVLSYTVKKDPTCRRDCETERFDLSRIPDVTGVDVGMLTISREVERVVRYGSSIDRTPGAMVVRTFNDLEKVRRSGQYGAILYTQQVPLLNGDPTGVLEWFDAGLRIVQPAYSSNLPSPGLRPKNKLAGGADEPDQGLTSLGRRVIHELVKRHMIIDVSHCSERTTFDIIQMTGVPILANHANAKALTLASRGPYLLGRNKSDRELLAIAETGGVIGVTTVAWMLDRDGDAKADIDDFLAHIDYLVRLVGINHVGIASDARLDGWGVGEIHYADDVLAGMDRWFVVARRLRHDLGYRDDDIRKIYGLNFKRVLDQVLPGVTTPIPTFPVAGEQVSEGEVRLRWSASTWRGVPREGYRVIVEELDGRGVPVSSRRTILSAGPDSAEIPWEAVEGRRYRWQIQAVGVGIAADSAESEFSTKPRP